MNTTNTLNKTNATLTIVKNSNNDTVLLIRNIGKNIQIVYTPGKRTKVYYKNNLVSLAWFDKNVAHISKGNKKLKPTKKVKFAIWNVISKEITEKEFLDQVEKIRSKCSGFDFNAALEIALSFFHAGKFISCPGATKQCKKYCYDYNAQSGYHKKSILPSRVRNFIFSCSPDFVELMTLYFVLRFETDKELNDLDTELNFRIHEGGEMYSQKYADDLIYLAFQLKVIYKNRIFPYTYTKSFFFLAKYRNENKPGHVFDTWLIVNGSLWNDSTEYAKNYVKETEMSLYTVLEKEQINEYKQAGRDDIYICECTDCGDCNQCRHSGLKFVEKH